MIINGVRSARGKYSYGQRTCHEWTSVLARVTFRPFFYQNLALTCHDPSNRVGHESRERYDVAMTAKCLPSLLLGVLCACNGSRTELVADAPAKNPAARSETFLAEWNEPNGGVHNKFVVYRNKGRRR